MLSLQLRNQEFHEWGLDESNASSKNGNLDGSSESRSVFDLLEGGRLLLWGHFVYD